ncbi:hypothetical protein [Methanoregula sp.]|uniref:hypothetical protein n=1 Tax=Methanoregula sp. TaxID=2052170 RepID=UPI000CB95EC5|nr:hypothetical protein [Methanoregula sp.]PKG31719.1 MAG: hypothetical protein CW742_11920 [Methanoregula sp.]
MENSDHDLLIRLDEKMDSVLKALADGNTCMKDHEIRINALESNEDVRRGAEKHATRTAAIISLVISTVVGVAAFLLNLYRGT